MPKQMVQESSGGRDPASMPSLCRHYSGRGKMEARLNITRRSFESFGCSGSRARCILQVFSNLVSVVKFSQILLFVHFLSSQCCNQLLSASWHVALRTVRNIQAIPRIFHMEMLCSPHRNHHVFMKKHLRNSYIPVKFPGCLFVSWFYLLFA